MTTFQAIDVSQLSNVCGGLEQGLHAWWFPTEERANQFVKSFANEPGFNKAHVFRSTYPKQPWFVNVHVP
jgi:hypothetical protein